MDELIKIAKSLSDNHKNRIINMLGIRSLSVSEILALQSSCLTKSIRLIAFAFALILIIVAESESQCSCIGGAAIGSASLIGGTSNIGVLQKGYLRAIGTLVHSNGSDFLRYDIHTKRPEEMLVRAYSSTFTGLIIGYGITDDLTVDIETGYFADKMQDYGDYQISGSGFSHSTIFLKYNLLKQRRNSFEWSSGIGAKLPLDSREQNLPQNIKSSNGAFGVVLLSFLRKGFDNDEWNLLMVNRYEWNDVNNGLFQAGQSLTNSLFVTKSLIYDFIAILELRSDFKLMDKLFGEALQNTGWMVLVVAPQLNYAIGDWFVTVFYEHPVYKYYNDTQLTNKQNFGIGLTWNSKIF